VATADPTARLQLAALRAFYLLADGDAADALAGVGPIPDHLDGPALAAAGLGTVPALLALGRARDGLALARRVAAAHSQQWGSGPLVLEPATSQAMLVEALRLAGHLDEAHAVSSAQYERLLARRQHPLAGLMATHLGSVALDRGQVDVAATWFERGAQLLRGTEAPGREALALGGLALALAAASDRAGAEAAVRAAERRPVVGAWSTVGLEARATVAVGEGDRDLAVDLLAEGARTCAARHLVVGALRCLHLLALIGQAELARDTLTELGDRVAGGQGPVVEAWVERIRAGAEGDADGLARLAGMLDELGFVLLAAESASEAAAQYRKQGDARRGQVLADRAAALAARCPEARPPWLVLDVRAVDPLTRREREIAVLAADGRTSREIADRLALSARTVENHLARVYAKLAIAGRSDLPAALGRR
jgi:DNA-binding CsgD family transcriptional regulator